MIADEYDEYPERLSSGASTEYIGIRGNGLKPTSTMSTHENPGPDGFSQPVFFLNGF
jgi:hypothetical protein